MHEGESPHYGTAQVHNEHGLSWNRLARRNCSENQSEWRKYLPTNKDFVQVVNYAESLGYINKCSRSYRHRLFDNIDSGFHWVHCCSKDRFLRALLGGNAQIDIPSLPTPLASCPMRSLVPIARQGQENVRGPHAFNRLHRAGSRHCGNGPAYFHVGRYSLERHAVFNTTYLLGWNEDYLKILWINCLYIFVPRL